MGKLVSYSVFIPEEHYKKLKEAARSRGAAALVRDGLSIILDNKEVFDAGYEKGIKDAAQVVYECPEAQLVAVKGRDIGVYLSEQIEMLIKDKK
jgi:hypothetical protein